MKAKELWAQYLKDVESKHERPTSKLIDTLLSDVKQLIEKRGMRSGPACLDEINQKYKAVVKLSEGQFKEDGFEQIVLKIMPAVYHDWKALRLR